MRPTAARVRPADRDDPGLGATEDPGVDVAGLLVLAARAAADLAERAPTSHARLRPTLLSELEDLVERAVGEPFATPHVHADHTALRATWAAEIGRLSGRPTLQLWAAASAAWDRIGRPHDSAYCRWRGARVALETGQASQPAPKLLRRAERDAREHVPLLENIRATRAAHATT